jgi:hypothetical protein
MTPKDEELLKLAERCEKATGPNYALEQQIGDAFWPELTRLGIPHKPFTASLDAAAMLTLGCDYSVGTAGEGTGGHAFLRSILRGDIETDAATPALALCAAALRTRTTGDDKP